MLTTLHYTTTIFVVVVAAVVLVLVAVHQSQRLEHAHVRRCWLD